MKITIIGCGNAFSKSLYNQSYLLEEYGRTLLLDCGAKVPMALHHHGIDMEKIDDIYISHLHSDHIGGLEEVAFSRYDWKTLPRPSKASEFINGKAPNLLCEKELIKKLWDKSLSGGLESMEGFIADLSTFFYLKPVDINKPFEWMGWECQMIQQVHIITGTRLMDSFGLIMSKEGHKTIYFTTDSQHCFTVQQESFYHTADVIFQDCEIIPFLTNVHANYIQLAGFPDANVRKLSDEVKAKMKLTHYQDIKKINKKIVVKNSEYEFYRAPETQENEVELIDFDWDKQAKEDGFDEFVKLGKVYEY